LEQAMAERFVELAGEVARPTGYDEIRGNLILPITRCDQNVTFS